MKRHTPSLAILLACLSTAAALNGCQWDSSEYDAFYNPAIENVYLCPEYCDTTGIDPDKLKEMCELHHGTYHMDHCYNIKEADCLALNNYTQSSCDNIPNKDECPYSKRYGIMINKTVYMFTTNQTNISDDNIYCGTYEEITSDFFMTCKEYFSKHSDSNILKKTNSDTQLNYEDMKELFIKSALSENKVCPNNTLSCTQIDVFVKHYNNDGVETYKGKTPMGFCSACAGQTDISCKVGEEYKCFDKLTTNEHCGSCDIDCTKDNKTCRNGQCVAPKCPLGEHYGDDGCEKDTVDSCGSEDNNCLSDQNKRQGWKDAFCGYDGQDTNGKYVNTDSAIDTSIDDFLTSCNSGEFKNCKSQCFANACDPNLGYHLFKGNCISDTHDCCGTECKKCNAAEMCSQGKCSDNCTAPLSKCVLESSAYCANLESDNNNCGSCGSICTSETITGSIDVTCNSSICEATSCDIENNYHIHNAICEKDEVTNCGGYGRDCQSIITGWSEGICKKGECIASACVTGYDLKDGKCEAKTSCEDPNTHYYNGECNPNDLNNCGKHEYACADEVTGWKTGNCVKGKCVAETCVTGYDQIDGACVAKTSCDDPNTHYYNGECIPNDLSNCGKHEYACANEVTGWNTGNCVKGKCVAETCVTGYDQIDGVCVAKTSCDDLDTHYYNGECIPNDLNNCGKHNNKCSDITGWSSGRCTLGVCVPSTCAVGYHLNGENICVADDADNCGSVGNKCGVGKVCTSGVCKDNCGAGEVRCEKAGVVSCADPNTSISYCGANSSCSTYQSCNKGQACVSGECVQIECFGNSTLCVVDGENQCIELENTNASHCGACNLKCSEINVSNASSNSCIEGKCQYTCDTDYLNCGSATIPNCIHKDNMKNDPNNCGRCGKKCEATEYCSNGTCTELSCPTNQHLNASGVCVPDTVNACGPSAIKCDTLTNWNGGDCINGKCVGSNLNACGETLTDCITIPGWAEGDCVDGVCTIDDCTENYHYWRNTCELNDETNCGRHNVACSNITLPNSATSTCTNAECIITVCDVDYHLSNDSKSCIENTLELCGSTTSSTTSNCNELNTEFVDSVECNLGTCKVKTCIEGYHITDATAQTCTANSNSACASPSSFSVKNCSSTINNSCSTEGNCCRDATTEVTSQPTCCGDLKCWKRRGQNKYHCSAEDPIPVTDYRSC